MMSLMNTKIIAQMIKRNEEGNERRNSHILAKGRCFWQSANYDLVDSNVGVFVASGHAIACNPWEGIY